MNKFRNPSGKELKILVIGFVLCCVLFFGTIIIYHSFFVKDKTLKIGDSINLKVTKVKIYKGSITLNDSIVLQSSLSRINPDSFSNRYRQIGKIPAKYRLYKKANSDSLIVVKDSERLIYKLPKKSNTRWGW